MAWFAHFILNIKGNLFNMTRAYQIQIGLDTRIIVHDRGLPPGWQQTNIDRETEERAIQKGQYDCVIHLHPETFDVIASYPLK